MFTATNITDYQQLNKTLVSLIEDETDRIANLSNAASLLNFYLKDINWVGFYLFEEESDQLVLGPFQGLPACVRIDNGKGVCGTAFRGNEDRKSTRLNSSHVAISYAVFSLQKMITQT